MRCERCHTRTSACSRAKLRFGCTSMSSLDAPAFEETRSSPEDELVTAVRTGDSAAFDRVGGEVSRRSIRPLLPHAQAQLRAVGDQQP